jgi:MoxR-like ATPase
MEVEWGAAMLVMSLLLDELNRASEKTQSAVLEPLEEGQITIAGKTVQLPAVHFTTATRNPIENRGTYPLSEAVLDRFWMECTLRIPRGEQHHSLSTNTTLHKSQPNNPAVFHVEQILAIRELIEHMVQNASRTVTQFTEDLLVHCRTDEPEFLNLVLEPWQGPRHEFDKRRLGANIGKNVYDLRVVKEGPNGEGGISPRGMDVAQMWVAATQAILDGRENINCQDVYDTFLAVNRHRLAMAETARVERITAEDILRAALRVVKKPSK